MRCPHLIASDQDVIHHAPKRRCCINSNASLWDIFFRCMQSHDQVAFVRSSSKLIFWSPLKPPGQSIKIDIENENSVEQGNKAMEIPGTAAEKGNGVALVSDDGFDFGYIPDVMRVPPCDALRHTFEDRPVRRFARLWVTLVGQISVTIESVVTASPQLMADRGLTRP